MTNFNENISPLLSYLQYEFRDQSLLKAALTHRSKMGVNNERLEFLGDSILNFVIASELFKRFPKAREGDLTRMRAMLVKEESVSNVARDCHLGEFICLGRGEKKTGGFQRNSILADALEAIIGAIYLDSDIETASSCILVWYENYLNKIDSNHCDKDPKTKLQEFLQSKHLPLPEYKVTHIGGGAHSPEFIVECFISSLGQVFEGKANSRRRAEQAAAERAIEALRHG